MSKGSRYSPEVRERAVRLVLEQRSDHRSLWAAVQSVATKIGCTPETLRKWVTQSEPGAQGSGVTDDEKQRLRDLERENRELRRANEILRKASAFFAQAELDRRPALMVAFIDRPPCRSTGSSRSASILPIAPSTYYEHKCSFSGESLRGDAPPGLQTRRGAWATRNSATSGRDSFGACTESGRSGDQLRPSKTSQVARCTVRTAHAIG